MGDSASVDTHPRKLVENTFWLRQLGWARDTAFIQTPTARRALGLQAFFLPKAPAAWPTPPPESLSLSPHPRSLWQRGQGQREQGRRVTFPGVGKVKVLREGSS